MSTTELRGATSRHLAEPRQWRIDPTRSEVIFRSRTFWGAMTVTGRFTRYDGRLDLAGEPAVTLMVDTASLDSGSAKRDSHLGSEGFPNAKHHPLIRFVSDRANLDGASLQIDGQLYAAGRSLPLRIAATGQPIGHELRVHAAVPADHRELGMTKNRCTCCGRRQSSPSTRAWFRKSLTRPPPSRLLTTRRAGATP